MNEKEEVNMVIATTFGFTFSILGSFMVVICILITENQIWTAFILALPCLLLLYLAYKTIKCAMKVLANYENTEDKK